MSSRPKRWRNDYSQLNEKEDVAPEDAGGDNDPNETDKSAFGIIMRITTAMEKPMQFTKMFMGTRADLAPQPPPAHVYAWPCARCDSETYSIAEPPRDSTWICHVCASELTKQAEQNASTHVMWNMADELEDSVKHISDEQKRPIQEVFNRFLEWKLGRPMNVSPVTEPEKKTDA
jgi:hypothetical protein